MKHIKICDNTAAVAAEKGATLSFKDKIELVRHMSEIHTDIIALPAIKDLRSDTLLVRTAAPFADSSVLSIEVGMSLSEAQQAYEAVSGAAHPRLTVKLPVSPTGMEYVCHRKPPRMMELVTELVQGCRRLCEDVELVALDATRAEPEFLCGFISAAVSAGASTVTLCDSAAMLRPDSTAAFISSVEDAVGDASLGIGFSDRLHLGLANTVVAIGCGVTQVTVCQGSSDFPSYIHLADYIRDSSDTSTSVVLTRVYRTLSRVQQIVECRSTTSGEIDQNPTVSEPKTEVSFAADEDINVIAAAVRSLGYDLGEDDMERVYESFCDTAARRKTVTTRELDAIVASVATQVTPIYTLTGFVINCGNIISSTANVTLRRYGEELSAVSMGDGPIDSAFRAIEQIVGTHFELDDFSIRSVTEGREALGSATVRLRHGGRVFAGVGISTDIIEASVRAYISALNKIATEEAGA